MKAKIVILSLVAMFICVSGYSIKPVEFGVKGGVTWQSVKLNAVAENYNLHAKDHLGMQLGVVGRINLGLIHLQPELLYSMNRYELVADPANGNVDRSRSIVKMNSFELPVLVGIKLLIFRINAGPVFNLMNEASVKSKTTPHSVNFTKSSISYMLGAGVDLGKVNLDVRYNGQFKRPLQSIQISGNRESGDYRTQFSNWAFTVAYMF